MRNKLNLLFDKTGKNMVNVTLIQNFHKCNTNENGCFVKKMQQNMMHIEGGGGGGGGVGNVLRIPRNLIIWDIFNAKSCIMLCIIV